MSASVSLRHHIWKTKEISVLEKEDRRNSIPSMGTTPSRDKKKMNEQVICYQWWVGGAWGWIWAWADIIFKDREKYCMYVCVCMCVCTYACMYACMYARVRVRTRREIRNRSFLPQPRLRSQSQSASSFPSFCRRAVSLEPVSPFDPIGVMLVYVASVWTSIPAGLTINQARWNETKEGEPSR